MQEPFGIEMYFGESPRKVDCKTISTMTNDRIFFALQLLHLTEYFKILISQKYFKLIVSNPVFVLSEVRQDALMQ